MKKLCGMLAVAAMFAVSACGGMGGGGDSGGGSGGAADYTINMYKDGTMKASYWVAVHKDVAAGQMAEVTTTSNFGGTESKSTMSTLCCKRDGDWAWIEQDMGQGYIMAYKVDLTKGANEPNVAEAWIGKNGEKPEAVKVMEVPKPVEGGEAPKVESTTGEETVNAAGKDWACTWTETKSGETVTKMWVAKDGWFGGMVKMEMKMSGGSSSMLLTKIATDGKAWLKWE